MTTRPSRSRTPTPPSDTETFQLVRVGSNPHPAGTLQQMVGDARPLRLRMGIQIEEADPWRPRKIWSWWSGVSWVATVPTVDEGEAFRVALDQFIRQWFIQRGNS